MIYVYDEPSHWGRAVAMACGRAGIPITYFKRADEVPPGSVAFVRLDQFRERRNLSISIIEELHRGGVRTLPSLEDAQIYDDKIAQLEKLRHFMPDTHLVYNDRDARTALKKLTFPFVSKSSVGANSANVRLVRNEREALKEISFAFSGRGIPVTYGRRQLGYLYWQRLVPVTHDYRIILVGDYAWGLVRQNRKDVPFASGSGINRTLTLETEGERQAFELGWQVKDYLGTDMVGLDIVLDNDKPLLLETTSSWTIGPHVTGPVFDREGNKTEYVRGHQWDLMVLVLKRMLEEVSGETAGHGVAAE